VLTQSESPGEISPFQRLAAGTGGGKAAAVGIAAV
jgi:hypothetical protein